MNTIQKTLELLKVNDEIITIIKFPETNTFTVVDDEFLDTTYIY